MSARACARVSACVFICVRVLLRIETFPSSRGFVLQNLQNVLLSRLRKNVHTRERPERQAFVLSALSTSECSFSPEINWLPFFLSSLFSKKNNFSPRSNNSFFSHNRHRILLFIKHLTHEYRYRHLKLRILYADTRNKKRTEESRAFESRVLLLRFRVVVLFLLRERERIKKAQWR